MAQARNCWPSPTRELALALAETLLPGMAFICSASSPEAPRSAAPAGLLVLKDGPMLIADDGGNLVWRVTYKTR